MGFWQADPRWSKLQLGNGTSTLGHGGCIATALCEAAILLTGRTNLTPPLVNVILQRAGAFSTVKGHESELLVEEAAVALGMTSPQSERVVGLPGDPMLSVALESALGRGDLALVRVDHNGDGLGDHTILATGWAGEPRHVDCLDPALARRVWVSWPDLRATTTWGRDVKIYKTVGVRPIRRVPQ